MHIMYEKKYFRNTNLVRKNFIIIPFYNNIYEINIIIVIYNNHTFTYITDVFVYTYILFYIYLHFH